MPTPRLAATAAALALAFVAGGAQGQATRDPPVSGDVKAALGLIRDGKAAEGRTKLDAMVRAGDPGAAEGLGEVLQFGLGEVSADPKAACRTFALALGKRGDATHNVALCTEKGVLGPPDPARAAQLYQQAADLGMQKSKCALGNLYRYGHGVATDKPRALKLCTEAAEAGVADAETDVGDIYLMGDGVPRDPVAARGWYEKAAAQHQANAALTLGQVYWNGDGTAKDNAKAAALWTIAYDAGRKDASRFLGDEAFVRAMRDKSKVDAAALNEAAGWYRIALTLPESENRAKAVKAMQVIEPLQKALGQTR